MKRLRAGTTVVAMLIGLTHFATVALAQRVLTIDEQQRADARKQLLAEQARDAARKQASMQEDAVNRQTRLNTATPLPGSYIKPNSIVVTRNRVIIMYMDPEVTSELPKTARDGYYVWRWDVNEGLAAFSVVLAADAPMHTSDVGSILKASRIRRCSSIFETAALSCTQPIQAFSVRMGQGFRIEISDTSIVKMVQMSKPRAARGVTFTPQGRSVSAAVVIQYWDAETNRARE